MDSEEALRVLTKTKMRVEVDNLLMDHQTKEVIRYSNFHFKYFNKCLNIAADNLAKQGPDRVSIIQGWF